MAAPTVDEPAGERLGRVASVDGLVSTRVRPERSVRIGRRRYPVLLPSLRDPRLHTASVLVSVQVLGQVALDFELSIAQILASVLTCALMEVAVTFRRRRVIAWPASAMLTGNGIALLLRVEGTEPGDWWSTRGLWIFIGVAVVSMLSKYLIRIGDDHLFNPSNIGLVAAFLMLGTTRINPQDFWWGPLSPGLVLTFAVILVGGVLITRRLGLLVIGAAYWVTFAAGVGLVAVSGHAMKARWNLEPVQGLRFWWIVVTSPEILIFLFFMITDPRTVPRGRVARLVYGVAVGLLSALLLAPQRTEFSAKVAVLVGLTLVSAARPLLERALPAPGSDQDRPMAWLRRMLVGSKPSSGSGRLKVRRLASSMAVVALAGLALIVAGSPARTAADPGSAVAGRPDIAIDEAALPTVEISPDLVRVNATITDDEAQRIALDLLADLEIERRALIAGDAELAATAVVGSRLEAVERALNEPGPRPTPPVLELTELTLSLLRRDPQAIPTFGFEARGTSSEDGGAPTPFEGSFSLELVGDSYLIASSSG